MYCIVIYYYFCHVFYTWASSSDTQGTPIPHYDTNKLIGWLIDWLMDWLNQPTPDFFKKLQKRDFFGSARILRCGPNIAVEDLDVFFVSNLWHN